MVNFCHPPGAVRAPRAGQAWPGERFCGCRPTTTALGRYHRQIPPQGQPIASLAQFWAATNKCLARSNKPRPPSKATRSSGALAVTVCLAT
jgi:hypothetical protein